MFHVIVAVLSVFGALWTLAIWLVGGFTIALPGMTIQSHDPFRPLALAAIAALIYVSTSGPIVIRRLITPWAILLALCPAVAGIARNSWTAGGADSYAYVSQAELWSQGRLVVPVPLAATAPWPDAVWTFAPHGFRPAVANAAIVPVTAPGLPLMMAAAKTVAGHCAMFLITPLSGALLVWLTFAIGRRLDAEVMGLVGAWLVATSPAVLAMLVSPMSDVPAAALWAAAIFFTLGRSPKSAAAAGLSASAAILVRPNLAPLAAILVLWKFWSERSVNPVALMIAGTLPGCVFIAWLNNSLYGSPLASGYGSLSNLFSMANVPTNFQRYGGWLIDSQTPLVVLGIAALIVPLKIVWPTPARQRAATLLGANVVTVWALYLIYTPYEAWWFLRFLLPCWPAICLGTAAVFVRMAQSRRVLVRVAAMAMILGLGVYGIRFAVRNGAFPTGEGDHRYVSLAKLVEEATDPSSVIFAGQHSGPTRYYAGRVIVRFDLLNRAWLDRAVQWLNTQGRRPYFLLEEWEMPLFQERFAPASRLGSLALAPVMAYRAPGVPGAIYLFDPARPDGGMLNSVPPAAARAKCVAPSPLLYWR